MPIVALIMTLLDLANKLLDRARQTGELTPEQDAALQAFASSIFARNSQPAPPPPGVTS